MSGHVGFAIEEIHKHFLFNPHTLDQLMTGIRDGKYGHRPTKDVKQFGQTWAPWKLYCAGVVHCDLLVHDRSLRN